MKRETGMKRGTGMKRKTLWVGLVAVVFMLAGAGLASAEPVTFTLVNGTGDTLLEFYASPPSVQEWEEDILGEDVLEPGEGVNITIADGREDCDYDFLAIFEEGNGDEYELEHNDVEICDGETYVYRE